MTNTTEITDALTKLPADDLAYLVNVLAGMLGSRFTFSPHGEPRAGARYPIYDNTEAVARTFEQAAEYLRTPRDVRLNLA